MFSETTGVLALRSKVAEAARFQRCFHNMQLFKLPVSDDFKSA